jgi:hypothetical protein
MAEILEDLKLQMVPYYAHFFHVLRALEDEFIQNHRGKPEDGLRSATLHELKAKVRAELERKQAEIEREVVEVSHLLSKERFAYSCQFYCNGTTPLLEAKGIT